ncbi:MAG: fibronectin type III domain-containing protein [Treponema sp.]|jgi:fibronectin type 3 domain-containing protein|nr:fibronectin type III domain-containing protein [Treponema sp.]
MKKKLYPMAALTLAALFFAGCPQPTGDSGGGSSGGGGKTDADTFIKFNNLDIFTVDVYADSGRSSLLVSVPAQSETAALEWTPGEASFYLKYHIRIGGADFPYIPQGGAGYRYTRVDEGVTKTVPIPTLIEALSGTGAELNQTITSDIYLKITNNSNSSLTFQKGSIILTPEGAGSTLINDHESAVYKVSAGPVSAYSFKKDNVTPLSFPAGLSEFASGKIYAFIYDGGSQLTLNPAEPQALSIAAAYGEKAGTATSASFPVPSSLAATALSGSEISLSWNISGSGNYTYYIFRAPSSDGEYSLAGISQEKSFVSSGLDSRTTYYYKVRAELNGQYSDYSQAVSARTLLGSPTGVTAETLSLSSIQVSWNEVPEASAYYLYRSGAETGEYTQIISTSGASYTDTGLSANAVYYYKICAYADGEYSGYSGAAYASTTNLQPPTGLTASAASATAINLSWTAASGATRYYIYRAASADGNYTEIANTAATSYSNTGLQGGDTWYYKVRSYYNGAYSNYSAAASAATPVSAPAGLAATALSSSEIRLAWNAVTTGAQYYYIYSAPASGGPWTEVAYITGTSYTHSGLQSGTTYYYKLQAFRNGVYSADSAVVSSITLPEAPVISSVTAGGAGELVVTWGVVTGATGYDLYYGTANSTGSATKKAGVTSPCTLTGFANGTTYYVWLKAKNASGESGFSAGVSGTTILPAPTGVTATAQSTSSIQVSWSAVTGANSYDVYYHTANNNSAATKVSNVTSPYTISSLSSGTIYYVWVKAKNASGESGFSSTANTVTQIPAPTGVSATDATVNSITVSWSAVTEATGYDLYYSTTTTPSGANKPGVESPYTLTGLSAGTTYHLWLKAKNAAGAESALSNMASALTIPAAPTGVTAAALSTTSIQVSWTEATGASGYDVYYHTADNSSAATKVSGATSPHTQSGLASGTRYYVWVKAKNSSGESAFSAGANAVTQLPAPTGVNATAATASSITLSWDSVTNATSYDLYYSSTTTAPSSAGKTSVASTSDTLTGLSAGTTYYIWVKAKNAVATSGLSAYTSRITVPAAPTGVQAAAQSSSSIQVSWSAVTGAASYTVYRSDSAGGTYSAIASGISAVSYTDSGLPVETTRYYKVSASNASGTSGLSAVVSVKTLPNEGLFIKNNSGYTVVDGVATPISIANALTWLNTNAAADTSYIIVISNDEALAPQTLSTAELNSKTGVAITLKGYDTERTVSLSADGVLFRVNENVTLTLEENISLLGRTSNTSSLVAVASNGIFNMKQGAKISGNGGGGVTVYTGGNFTMSGGEISGNTKSSSTGTTYGGGVYVTGTFTMSGGKISGNTATTSYSAASSFGGGVYVSGTFTMRGGEISGNTANYGGGVSVYGTFTMSGGEISGNTVSYYGGGVYVPITGGIFMKSGGVIYGSNAASKANTSTGGSSYGHAVYVNASTIKKRNTTAGATVSLDSTVAGSAGGWE